jgi:hypothetical protein
LVFVQENLLHRFRNWRPSLSFQNSTTFSTFEEGTGELFDLTVCEGSLLKFLNLRIVQSPSGISFDQKQHIQCTILLEYFKDVPPTSIPRQLHPFPIDASFEK